MFHKLITIDSFQGDHLVLLELLILKAGPGILFERRSQAWEACFIVLPGGLGGSLPSVWCFRSHGAK